MNQEGFSEEVACGQKTEKGLWAKYRTLHPGPREQPAWSLLLGSWEAWGWSRGIKGGEMG